MGSKQKDIPLWFSLLICSFLIYGLSVIVNYKDGRLKTIKNDYLRDSFSPMSDGEEIIKAYKEL